jgi:hypothetical protein|nr:MAG TPA: Protein of unknown function (DUF551) [Caudoviricetes sp.]
MSDGMTFVQNEDGAFSAYDDSYDVVIHCETEEEQKKVIERLKAKNWIPVSERLPEEYDSIFAKFKGTDNWKRGMFEKTSKYVIATVIFDDGAVLVEQAHTTDGIWRTDNEVLGGTVVAWMEYPEPYKED